MSFFYTTAFVAFLFVYVSVPFAEEAPPFPSEDAPSDKEELQVQESFPLYRVDFNRKAVQEEVYQEFLKALKEKEKNPD